MGRRNDILLDLKQTAVDLLGGAPRGLGRAKWKSFEPFEWEGLVVRCDSRWSTKRGFITAWDELSQTAPAGTAFHSPAWQAGAFLASGAKRLRLITVREEQRLLAVLPMQLSPAGGLGTIGPWMVDYLDPLIAEREESRVWPAVLRFILAHWDRRTKEIVLHNVREPAPLRRILPPIAAATEWSYEEHVVDHAPAIALPGTWEEYLAQLDAHERKELRRKMKKAEEKGHAQLVGVSDSAIDEMLRFMELAGGAKAKTVRQYLRPLLRQAAPPLLAARRMEILRLQINDQAAGYLMQFPTPQGPMLYNSGHDPAMREWSPGVVAIGMAIRRAIENGAKIYDMLRGREAYKYRLGAVDRALYRVTLRPHLKELRTK